MTGMNGGVPPNIVWDPLNPPMKNECSGMLELHTDDCPGDCPTSPCSELQVLLINENREYARLNMTVQNIPVNVFRNSIQIAALIDVVADVVGQDALDLAFQKAMYDRMHSVRIANQDRVKRANLGLPPKQTILGPDGNPL